MRPEFFPVLDMGKGVLAIMAKPRSGEWLEDEIVGLSEAGIRVLVCLLEATEVRELDLGDEADLCGKHGVEFISFPITDRGVPDSMQRTIQLSAEIRERALSGLNVAIHCRSGIGRASLLAAGVLVLHGLTPGDAFQTISTARRVRVPDTDEQIRWIEAFAQQLGH